MPTASLEPPVVVKLYRAYQTFIPLVLKFPKPYRYTIGQRVELTFLAALEYIFEANALPRPLREAPLLKALAKCDLLKLLIRFCFERDLIESTQYFQLITDIQECAKMLSGWIAYVRNGPSSSQQAPPRYPLLHSVPHGAARRQPLTSVQARMSLQLLLNVDRADFYARAEIRKSNVESRRANRNA